MNNLDKKLCNLVDYIQYLDENKKYNYWNKGYFRKIKKLLKEFCVEYAKEIWKWC